MQNPPKNGGKQGPSAPVAVPSKKPDSDNGSLIKPNAVDEGNNTVGMNANVKVSTSTNGNIQIVRTSSAPPNIGEQEKAFGKQTAFLPAKMPQHVSPVSATQTKNTTTESTDKIQQNGSTTQQPTVAPVTTSSMNPNANFQPKPFNGPSTGVPPFNASGARPMNYPRYQQNPYAMPMMPSPYYPMMQGMPPMNNYYMNPMAQTPTVPIQPPVAQPPTTPPAKKAPLLIINPTTNQEVKAPPSPAVQTPTPSTPGSGMKPPAQPFTPSPNKGMFPEMAPHVSPSANVSVTTPMKATPPKVAPSPTGALEIRKPEPLEIRKPEPLQIKKPEGSLEIKKPEATPEPKKVEPKVEEKKPEEKKPEPVAEVKKPEEKKPEPVKVEGPLEIKKPEPKVKVEEKKTEEKKPEPVAEVKKPEEKKPEVKEEKPAEQKPEQKPEPKPVQAETKPVEAPKTDKKEEPKAEAKKEEPEKNEDKEEEEEEEILVRYPSNIFRPNNTSGVLVYPKEFLKQFQSLVGKMDHPDVESIAQNHADDFSRGGDKKFKKGGYDSPGSGRGGAPPGFEGKGRRGGLNRSGSARNPPKKKEEKPVNPNRWESVKLGKKSLSGEEVLIRKFQNNLNKLADDNQDSITAKILEIPVESADMLAKFIKLIFDKAVSEKKFVNIYAELCKELSTKVPDFSTPEKKQSFRTLLLTRCQTEFETNFPRITGKVATATATPTPTTATTTPAPAPVAVAPSSSEGKKEGEAPSAPTTPTTPTTTGPPALLTPEEIEFIHRSKMFGNIHFVGELYKNKMLTEKVMYSCIETLLGDVEKPIPDYMEALTKLLLVIGPILDQNTKSKPILDKFFGMITTCSKNKEIAPRVRFMLEDLIAARKSGWSVKHAIPASAPTQSASSLPTVSKTDSKKEVVKENPKKAQDFQTVKGGNVKTTQAKEIPKKSTTAENINIASKNQFSLLSSSPTNADISLRPQGGFNKFASSSTKDKEAQAQKNPPKPKQNDEELGLKADQLLEELLGAGDIPEAVRCVKEDLTSAEYFYTFVSRCIVLTIEEDRPKDRVLMRDFLAALLKQNIINQDHFQKAYENILETLEEMVVDFPKAPQLLAQIICTAVVDKLFNMEALKILEGVDKSEGGALRPFSFVASIFRQLLKEFKSEQKIVELYRQSGLDMMKFLQPENQNPDDLMELLSDEGLRCLNP